MTADAICNNGIPEGVSDNTLLLPSHPIHRSLQIALARLGVLGGRVDIAMPSQRRHLVDTDPIVNQAFAESVALTMVCGDTPAGGGDYPGAGALQARDLALPRMAPHRSQSPAAIRLQSPVNRFRRGKRIVTASPCSQASGSDAASLAVVADNGRISFPIRLRMRRTAGSMIVGTWVSINLIHRDTVRGS